MQFLLKWFDNHAVLVNPSTKIDWLRVIPFVLLHLSCLLVIYTGISVTAVAIGIGLFWLRMFAICGFYHRYFSHRTYQTHRIWQFLFAVLGASAAQRGPIWWAAHHRHHHQVTDTAADPHSPHAHSFWRSHIGWFLSHKYFHYDPKYVKDLLRFPELCWLDRYDTVIPLALIGGLFALGEYLKQYHPALHCSGLQLIAWGFCISTVVLLHVAVSINSIAHKYGSQPYQIADHSRNNLWLALLTLGEGWHNNHHRYPAATKQGFLWWEIDITYYVLKLMEKIHIIRDLHPVPKHILDER